VASVPYRELKRQAEMSRLELDSHLDRAHGHAQAISDALHGIHPLLLVGGGLVGGALLGIAPLGFRQRAQAALIGFIGGPLMIALRAVGSLGKG